MVGVVHAIAHATGGAASAPRRRQKRSCCRFGHGVQHRERAAVIGELAPLLCGRDVPGSEVERAKGRHSGGADLQLEV